MQVEPEAPSLNRSRCLPGPGTSSPTAAATARLADNPVTRTDPVDWSAVLEQLDVIRGFSLQQPWLWAVMNGGKPVENRRRIKLPAGRLVWLHASRFKSWDQAGESSPLVRAAWHDVTGGQLARNPHLMPFGAIVGLMESGGYHHWTDCAVPLRKPAGPGDWVMCSPWAAYGQFHNQIGKVHPLPEPVPCNGMLGFWPLPPAVLAAVRAQVQELAARAAA